MTKGLGIVTGRFGRVALLDMDTSLTTHAHAHCHAVFKVAGPDQHFTVDGALLPLKADTAVLVNAWQEHQYAHRDDRERSVFLALYLDTDWLARADRLFSSCGRPAFFAQPGIAISAEAELWRDRLIEMIETGHGDAGAVEEAILQLTWTIGRSVANPASPPARAPDYRVRRALRSMREHPAEPYDYDALAGLAGLSRSRFNTLFRDCTGVTPAVYGNAIRIEASVCALGDPATGIGQVSDDLGFSAASNFCRFFQQHTGLTPSDYRRVTASLAG